MPVSLNQLLRYRVIDRCLKDRSRKYFGDNLLDAIEEEFIREGLPKKRPSRRTLDYDISYLRAGKMGVEAPISFSVEDGYYYEDPTFSLYKVQLSSHVIRDLTQAIFLLKQITQNDQIANIKQSIEILQSELMIRIDEEKKSIVFIDKSTNELGHFWISELYNYISAKKCIRINYIPFGKDEMEIFFSPYLLHEFNNRWFVTGWDHEEKRVIHLGLDRINAIAVSLQPYFINEQFNYDDYRRHLYGVTIYQDSQPVDITFKANWKQAFYISTKPIHISQKVIESNSDFTIFRIHVFLNHEIMHHFLSFGSTIEVLEPLELRAQIQDEIKQMAENYSDLQPY